MAVQTVETFNSPCKAPNGLQWTDEGLFVIDQITDNVYVMDDEGYVVRAMPTITANGSGITVGGGYLWTASNGTNSRREQRDTDTGVSWIYQLNLKTGAFVNRYPTPDGGGIHGIEWDNGKIWATSFITSSIALCDPDEGMKAVHRIPNELKVMHGFARDGEGLWCADRRAQAVAKYSVETGELIDYIDFPPDSPDPHGLSIKDGVLWYCDANVGGKGYKDYLRDRPEIGIIAR